MLQHPAVSHDTVTRLLPADSTAHLAYDTITRMGERLIAAVPRFVAAAIVVLALYYVGSALRWATLRGTHRWRGRESLELALARIIHAAVIAFSLLVAATIAFPSFTPASLIQLLGVSGIAIGFAFKDIFQNFLAGVLLLVTQPFGIGDQIAVDAYEGTVENIHTRATLITTYDQRRVVVPNADLFTKSVTVNTAFAVRRSEFDLTLGATIDVDAMRRRLAERVSQVEDVASAPSADVLLVKFDAATTTLRVRWWTSAHRETMLRVQDRVLTALRAVVAEAAQQQPPRQQGGSAPEQKPA